MAARGERKFQILQTLADMLEVRAGEKITTAALAARLDVSEAALYRHFASKAQMFEGLIEFIEQSLFGLINKIIGSQQNGLLQTEAIVSLLLGFAQKNPGMTRVLIGDALINENERLQARINQLHDRVEATLRQCLRIAAGNGDTRAGLDTTAAGNMLLCHVIGRWHQFAKSGFKRLPTEEFMLQWGMLSADLKAKFKLQPRIRCNPDLFAIGRCATAY